MYYPYSKNKGADQLICAFVFTYAKSQVSLEALKLNILHAANINVFCASQYYKYIYARLTSSLGSVTSFQCTSSSPWLYQGAEGSSFVQAGKGIRSNQSFFG